MLKPKLDLQKRSDDGVADLGTDVHDAIVLHAGTFPDCADDVTALATENTTFIAALEAARQGKIAQQALIDAKDAARAVVEARLKKIAAKVDYTAQGDVEIIHEAGMQASNEPTPKVMTQVQNLRLTAGVEEGVLKADWDPVEGKLQYQVQICTDADSPPTNWVDKLRCGTSYCSLNDTLVSGQKIWVRVRAEGARSIGPWSDPAWKRVP